MKKLLTAVWGIAGVAYAGSVTFKAPPGAVREGEKTKITFSVTAPADVEVAVLDGTGKIVRHLAAGVLGGTRPPPEPLQAGLEQALIWDGRDDDGRAIAAQDARVRVRAGMSVAFGRTLGGSPYTGQLTGNANLPGDGLAVGSEGTLYVRMGSFVPNLHEAMPWHLRMFDKTGKYLKTILPYPPSTDPAKTPAFRLLDAGDGLLTPVNTTGLDPVLFQLGDGIHNRTIDGCVVFVDGINAKLNFVKLDGSNAIRTVPMRTASKQIKWPIWLVPQVAFSLDGKVAYYANVAGTIYDGKKPSDIDPNFPQGRVYRHDLAKEGAGPEKFYDLELPDWEKSHYWMPSAWDRKTAAAGLATDAKGNLLVCDLVNEEIVEVSPEGRKLSSFKAPSPDKIAVSRKAGTIYVVSRRVTRGIVPAAELIKVTGRGPAAVIAARLPLKGRAGHSIALDESGEVPVLWLGGGSEVVRVEDRGAELVAGPSILNPSTNDIGFVCFGDVDSEAELVYVTSGMGAIWRYHGDTGEGGLAPIKACDVAIGVGGMIYGWGDTGNWNGPITRYTRDYKPAPLASTGKHTYGNVFGRFGRGNNAPGMDVDRRGWVYAACGYNDCHIRVYDADGQIVPYERKSVAGNNKVETPAFLSYVWDQGGSMRVDAAGNVYVLEIGLPKGFLPPKGFEKDPAYARCSGTIYKFTPKGGEFRKGANGWEAVGAVQTYPGCGPISGSWNSTGSSCHCMRPRYDVDDYGRLYIPEGMAYQVSVRDNADNEIVRFGGYGNYDAEGPLSREPKPAIAFGWPVFAGASDKHIYVGDSLNHRLVRVDKKWAVEMVCAVK